MATCPWPTRPQLITEMHSLDTVNEVDTHDEYTMLAGTIPDNHNHNHNKY